MIAVKFNNEIKFVDSQFRMKNKIKFDEKIKDVFSMSKNEFLVLSESNVFLVNGSNLKKKEIKFEEIPLRIFSGVSLDENHFFLHMSAKEWIYEGRIYNRHGKLISKKRLSHTLRYIKMITSYIFHREKYTKSVFSNNKIFLKGYKNELEILRLNSRFEFEASSNQEISGQLSDLVVDEAGDAWVAQLRGSVVRIPLI